MHDNAPSEVMGNDELRFDLRMENANRRIENVKRARERATQVEEKGGFRTLLQPMAFKRRAGIPNWSSEVHAVQSTDGGRVTDDKGKTYDTRLVFPVSATSSAPAQVFAGGSKPRDDRRRNLSREFLQPLKEIVGRAGNIGMSQAPKDM